MPHVKSILTCPLLLSLATLGSGGLLIKEEGGGALSAVDSVKVVGHECAGTTVGALLTKSLHFARVLNLHGTTETIT